METKQRLLWADSLKGWLMLLVIFGHAIQSVMQSGCFDDHVWNLIYSFHMPAFMAVSGWFAWRPGRRAPFGSVLQRRFWQLLVPYVAWSLLSIGLSGGHDLLGQLGMMVLKPDSFFWFLWVLFLINCVFLFCQWASAKTGVDELAGVGAMCLALFLAMVVFEVRVCGFQFLSYYFLFYALGYCVHRFPRLRSHGAAWLSCLFVVWAALAWSWNMHNLPAWMPAIPHLPSSVVQYAYRGLTAAVAILLIFGCAPRLLDGGNRCNLTMKEVGNVSLGLYVCHLTLMKYVVQLISSMLPGTGTWPTVALAFLVCVLASFAIVELLKRNSWTARVLLGKL